jgi:hypothetical protein
VEGLLGSKYGVGCAILHCFCQDAVAVVIVQYEKIVVAVAGWGDEATSLVGVNLAGWFEDGSVTVMRAGLIDETGEKRVVGVVSRRGWLGGALVFASLV